MYVRKGAIPQFFIPFIGKLFNRKVLWLGLEGWYPTIAYDGDYILMRLFDRNDSIPKLFVYAASWIFIIMCQVFSIGLFFFWVLLNGPITIPLLWIGLYLYQSKLIAYGTVRTHFFRLWTGGHRFKTNTLFDLHILNESLFAEFAFQAFPQLILQFINNYMLEGLAPRKWSNLSLLSLATSGIIFVLGFLRYGRNALSREPFPIQTLPMYLCKIGNFLVQIKHEEGDDIDKSTDKGSSDKGDAVRHDINPNYKPNFFLLCLFISRYRGFREKNR